MYSGSLLSVLWLRMAADPARPRRKYPASALARDGVACEGGFARLPVSGVDSPGRLAEDGRVEAAPGSAPLPATEFS